MLNADVKSGLILALRGLVDWSGGWRNGLYSRCLSYRCRSHIFKF